MTGGRNRVLLIILDGFGINPSRDHNAIALAKTPYWNQLTKSYPHSQILTSGEAVGLPKGVMGNSEVGHLNIGGGRVIQQDITRISKLGQSQGFDSLPEVHRALTSGGTLHIMGLLSDGCVHSDLEHLILLLKMMGKYPNKKIQLHLITDGRDTAPRSALRYLEEVERELLPLKNGKIASIVGRYYAMDRDRRWERVQRAYDLIALRQCPYSFSSAKEAIEAAYLRNENDEFIQPSSIGNAQGVAVGDQFLFFNFRSDRAREISMAFALQSFKEFETPIKIDEGNWLCMTCYNEAFPFPVLFPKVSHKNILGEVLQNHGLQQLRVAETEKYAHVTYYFNGGHEEPFVGEDRTLIPSPKDVPTYDLKPEMSAEGVTEAIVHGIRNLDYDLIVANYANGDMVGHTGVESAAIKAVETLDQSLFQVITEALLFKCEVLITADHGNCELMVDPSTGVPFTQHTTFPVPLVWVSPRAKKSKLRDGILADIAPTVLDLLTLSKPQEMTGCSLIS